MQYQKNNKLEVILILLFSVISLIIWESYWIFPIKLLVVLIHEFSHTLVAIITGGNVEKIIFNLDLSGITETTGGNQILIAASGYPGSLLAGALLFLSADHIRLRKWVTNGLAALFLIIGINLVEGDLQIFLCISIALFFLLVPRYLNEMIISFFFRFIGLTSCLYVIADIKQDLLTVTLRETDAQILEYLLNIPSPVIGLVWFSVSVITVFFLLKKSLQKND